MHMISKLYFCALLPVLGYVLVSSLPAEASGGDPGKMSPVEALNQHMNNPAHATMKEAFAKDKMVKASNPPGGQNNPTYGGMLGGAGVPQQDQSKMLMADKGSSVGGGGSTGGGDGPSIEVTNFGKFEDAPRKYVDQGQAGADAGVHPSFLDRQKQVEKFSAQGTIGMAWLAANNAGFDGGGGGTLTQRHIGGYPASQAGAVAQWGKAAGPTAASIDAHPGQKTNSSKSNGQGNQSSGASSAGEDAIECMTNALDGITLSLINVANEDAGSPCASNQVSKTYSNAVWMVQKMYKACFIPMAILFLLPGALITNIKTFISFGFLHNNDEDTVSPFAGIFRSTIAIFLIPATQIVISYMVDVGNSLQNACLPYVDVPLIILWAEEQVQTYKPDQQGKPMKNLPNVPMAPWRGKFAGMPKAGAIVEQVSGLDAALSELANECTHILSEGLTIAYAFQLVMICYLLLLGPLAAAFFAWPAVGRDLFRKCFATWVDGVVVLSLWKFWWNVVLITMTVRCQSGALNPFDPFEVYYLVGFLCILMTVPFNPFDFKPGEIVSHALEKAQSVANKVAQGGGKGGGGGGPSGGSKKKGAHPMGGG